MIHLHSTARAKLVIILITLAAATAANASLLDCTTFPEMKSGSGVECVPAEALVDIGQEPVQDTLPPAPINTALASFQVDQTRSTSAVPESAPLLILIGAVLGVVLIRAKSYNSK